METLRLLTALLLPWLLGITWLRYIWNPTSEGNWATLLGYGYLLGVLVTVLVMLTLHYAGFSQHFLGIAAILSLLAGLGLWLSRDKHWRKWSGGILTLSWQQQTTWQKYLFGLLLTFILVRFTGIFLEILWRPLYPWDALMNWAPKARVWFEYQTLIPFVDRDTWLGSTDQVYNLSNPHANRYPPLVPLVQLWVALAIDHWDESLINLPWLLCAGALGLAFYGQARSWGASPLLAIAFLYLLLSMPFIDTHVALAGYAELWLATSYALAAMAFIQWVRTGDRRQAVLALIFVMALPLIKIPGVVWIATFVPALLVALLPARALMATIVVIGAIVGVVFLGEGLNLTIPGLGELIISPAMIQLPFIGTFRFDFQPIWDPFYKNLFALANWHLFWFLFLITVAVLIFSRLLTDRTILTMLVLALAAITSLLFIFLFIPRYQGEAMDYSTINRAIMHMVPMLAFFILIVWQESFGKADRNFNRHSRQ